MTTKAANPFSGKISVLNIAMCEDCGTVRAFASVVVGTLMEIRSIKIIQQEGQRAYVKLPDHQDKKSKQWFPTVKCTDERLCTEISRVVLAAWSERQ